MREEKEIKQRMRNFRKNLKSTREAGARLYILTALRELDWVMERPI